MPLMLKARLGQDNPKTLIMNWTLCRPVPFFPDFPEPNLSILKVLKTSDRDTAGRRGQGTHLVAFVVSSFRAILNG
jgi:hypothetical protein